MKRSAVAVLLALAWVPARAGAGGVDVALTRTPDQVYEIEGGFSVAASTGTVWDVLCDYERLPAFVPSMRLSRVVAIRPDGTLLLEQETIGGLFFARKRVHVLLEVRRRPDVLEFQDVGRRDFWIYEGSWRARGGPDGTRVSYRLVAQPDFPAPTFLLRGTMTRGARDLLARVRDEVLRRSALPFLDAKR